MDKDNLSHLLANPYFMKKKSTNNYDAELQNDLMMILNKLFPEYRVNDFDPNIIFEKIEKICMDLYIDKITNNIIDNIIIEIIKNEQFQQISEE